MNTTPLTAWHRDHGANMMEFGGYDMPVEYSGIIQEHENVRHAVGMFDVSHMAEFSFEGPETPVFLDHLVTNIPSQLANGQALYTPMCYPTGGTVDDLLIYRIKTHKFLMVVNAANHLKDWTWIAQHAQGYPQCEMRDMSQNTALIAVQGPLAKDILQALTPVNLNDLEYYHALFDDDTLTLQ